MALELGWKDTFVAEYLALTKLQADSFVTNSSALADSAKKLVTVASMAEMLA